jgi:hypothetical protein
MSNWSVSKRTVLLIVLFMVAAFRLFLVADRDILATFSPYDEYWHVDAALRRIIGGSYHHMVFAHLPLYAIWLMVLSDFGIPARLAIDIFWLIGSGYLAFALSNLSRSVWVGILAFILLAYHPYSLVLFDRALAETFLTVISAFVLAAALEIWTTRLMAGGELRRKIALVVFSISFAIAFHTRKEGFLLLLPIIVVAMLSWVKKKDWWSREMRNYLGIPLIASPIMATLALGVLLASVNYACWGVFARYELAAPQYIRAINALIAVNSGKPTPRHVTVTAATRDIAYRASPTFALLRPYFDGGVGQNLARMTTAMEPGVTGEIGDWVFYWAVRDAAAAVGWHSNAKNAEVKYKAIADELEEAFAKGAIKRRSVLVSFVDPDWKKWVIYLPMSVLRVLNLVVSPSISSANLDRPSENATSKQFADYSLLLGRRRVPQHAEMVGWAVAPAGSLIGLGGDQGGGAWSLLDAPARSDVVGAIPFSIRGSETERPSKLYMRLDNGKIGQLDLSGLWVGQIRELNGLEGIRVGIEHLYVPTVREQTPRLERLSGHIDFSKPDAFLIIVAKLWSLIAWMLLASTFIAISVAVYKKVASEVLVILGLVSLIVLARAGLFGLLDASSWYGQVSRYMFPAVPFFIVGIVLGTSILSQLIREKINEVVKC